MNHFDVETFLFTGRDDYRIKVELQEKEMLELQTKVYADFN